MPLCLRGEKLRPNRCPAGPGRYNPEMLRRLEFWPDWKIALAVTVFLRVSFTVVAAVASPFLHPDPALIHSNALTENLPAPGTLHYALFGIWERFDTLWYLHIAAHGYDRPMAVIFYPLYPAAIRVMSWAMPATVAALAVSTVAAFFAFWGLLRLAAEHTAVGRQRMILIFGVWPPSFILFAGYADSLTLALVAWAVVFGRQRRWERATACGLMAGIARPTGILVCVPLALMALRSRQVRSLVVAMLPLGFAGYWYWLRMTGRPPVVEAYRLYQGMTMAAPWQCLAEAVRLIAREHDALLAIKLAIVVAFAVISMRRGFRLEDKAFAIALILQMLMYTGRPLLGAARYVLLVYPAFLQLGSWAERWNGKQLGFCLVASGMLNLAWMWAFLNWSLVL